MNDVKRRSVVLFAAAAALLTLVPTIATAKQPPVLEGIDVSNWQGAPVWPQVRDAGVQFVIAKASEGRTWRDGQYARNRRRSHRLGIPFTAYHFAKPGRGRNDAVMEADNFVAAAQLQPRDLLPVLDLEHAGGLGVRKLRAWVRAWLARVESRLGVKPIIYVSPSFWRERMGDSQWFAKNGYRLWIAHWGVDQPAVPAGNWAGVGWTFWQYGGCTSVDGISGCVDPDVFNGDDLGGLTIAANR